MAFFSVIMPCHNSAKYLKDAANSVLNQTFNDLELLAVDDASTDGSRDILLDIAKTDDRLKIIEGSAKKSAAAARNTALPHVSGKYLAFMDSDDTLESDFLRNIYELIEKDNSVDVYKFGAIEEYIENGELAYKKELLPPEGIYEGKDILKVAVMMEEMPLFGYLWNGVYKASIVKEHNIVFDERYLVNEDFLFNIDYLKNTVKMQCVAKAYYHYQKRDNGVSLSSARNKDYLESHIIKVKSFLDFFDDLETDDPLRRRIFWLYFRIVLSALERAEEDKREEVFRSIKENALYKEFKGIDFSKEILKRRFMVSLFKFSPLCMVSLISFVRRKFPIIFAKVKR